MFKRLAFVVLAITTSAFAQTPNSEVEHEVTSKAEATPKLAAAPGYKAVIKAVNLNVPLSSLPFGPARLITEPSFEIALSDESLSLALRRWASESKYQLVWDAGKDFPARMTTYEARNFVEAVEQVMADTEASGYPLHACVYTNQVVRVLHVSQTCQRN